MITDKICKELIELLIDKTLKAQYQTIPILWTCKEENNRNIYSTEIENTKIYIYMCGLTCCYLKLIFYNGLTYEYSEFCNAPSREQIVFTDEIKKSILKDLYDLIDDFFNKQKETKVQDIIKYLKKDK